jgi:hypothetical protein
MACEEVHAFILFRSFLILPFSIQKTSSNIIKSDSWTLFFILIEVIWEKQVQNLDL